MLPTELKTTFSAYILTPVAFIIGVPWSDSFEVARLISLKVVFNEFVESFYVRVQGLKIPIFET